MSAGSGDVGTPPETEDLPAPPDARDRPRVGVDEWVARHGERRLGGRLAPVRARWEQIPGAGRLLGTAALLAFLPALTHDDYVLQVALGTLLFMLLALGLNIAVGFAGLLDLGYVAFYGFGAYMYAFLASRQFGVHWQAEVVIPLVVLASVVLGFLLGLPSRRLEGDYLAIVTLFFLQIFITLLNNADRLNVPFAGHVNFTNGPNGISSVDAFRFLGWRLESLRSYYWFTLCAFVLVIGGLYLVNQSRTGRAWRALREDPLAAELMTMPVRRLKLMAFAFGAAVAGLTGTIFAAQQGAAFPSDFDLTLLITLYAMVILGGTGSLAGVALGAIAINVGLEVLRTPAHASWVFYGLLLAVVVAVLRARRGALVLGTLALFGFAVHALAAAAWPAGTSGKMEGGASVDHWLRSWVLVPRDPVTLGRIAYIAFIASILLLVVLRGWTRLAVFVPVLYLGICVWENVLVLQPSVARYIMLGAMLVTLMAARPQGLLGTSRVEIV